MSELFVHQVEAQDYAANIADRSERVWVQYMHSRAIGYLVHNRRDLASQANGPVDLLLLVKIAHESFRPRAIVERILAGDYEQASDIDEIF